MAHGPRIPVQGVREPRAMPTPGLGRKNALCDALRDFLGSVEGYPDAHVVFVPELAAGSELLFDFKVTYGG